MKSQRIMLAATALLAVAAFGSSAMALDVKKSLDVAAAPDAIDMVEVRRAIHGARKIQLGYRDEKGEDTQRKIWPIAIGYLETVRMVVGWCELRNDFRHFRTDRITAAAFLEERTPERPTILRARWRQSLKEKAFRERLATKA